MGEPQLHRITRVCRSNSGWNIPYLKINQKQNQQCQLPEVFHPNRRCNCGVYGANFRTL